MVTAKRKSLENVVFMADESSRDTSDVQDKRALGFERNKSNGKIVNAGRRVEKYAGRI